MTKAPKCRFCNKEHYGNCAPAKERLITKRRIDELISILDAAESRITRSWMEMGKVLTEIRDSRLYRDLGHATFEAFCQTRGYSRQQAYRLIEASGMAQMLPIGDRPSNEAQARELKTVMKDEGPQAVAEVMEKVGPKPTAAKIRKAVQERNQPELTETYEIEPACTHPKVKCVDCGVEVKR